MIRQSLLIFSFCLVLIPCASFDAAAQDSQKLREALEALEILEDDESLNDPENIMAWVTVPRSMKQGDKAVLVLAVENGRPDQEFRMSSVDIYDKFLDGFEIVAITPKPRHKDHSMGCLTLDYPIDIPPGETWELKIGIRAKESGVYIGDVDVSEGEQFLTRAAQVRVE